MRRWTIYTVDNLALSDKEIDNDNRKRTGYSYRVFLSWYCIKFGKLDPVQQQNMMGVDNNINNKEEEDGDDDDITVPPIEYHNIAKTGAVV